MSTATNPHALEGFVGMVLTNIAGAVHQIRSGAHPEYDDNCRRDIGDSLARLASTRLEQLSLDPDYPVGLPVQVAGLREEHLPEDMPLGTLRRVRRFVLIPA
ncbi:MAG: hypothetical protein EBT79_10260 [Actinobacteria bacterium]|nr:hypothetical protein [Actinomycetota bacterium]NBR67638.1 hypothetical protein [Actinomycetota bacterium]